MRFFGLTHWPSDNMVTHIMVNFGSGSGMVPDGTKPLPEIMLPNFQSVLQSGIHLRAISLEIFNTIFLISGLDLSILGCELGLSRVSPNQRSL